MAAVSFKDKMDEKSLAYFNEVCEKPFSQQACAFLNAYWPEVGSQAEFIFSVAWEVMKYSDMHFKGVTLIHKYEEGVDVDLNVGLYFYEKLCSELEKNPKYKAFTTDEYALSKPTMMTAIARKRELREKVDVNFDGRISMLEYLLHQFMGIDGVDPCNFCVRAMTTKEHPEITKARLALEEVNKAIKQYENKKAELEEIASSGTGVKAMRAKNELAQLGASPLWEKLDMSLIRAESLLRRVTKKFKGMSGDPDEDGAGGGSTSGSVWWMNRDLEEKKKLYGPMKKK